MHLEQNKSNSQNLFGLHWSAEWVCVGVERCEVRLGTRLGAAEFDMARDAKVQGGLECLLENAISRVFTAGRAGPVPWYLVMSFWRESPVEVPSANAIVWNFSKAQRRLLSACS